MKKLNSSNGAGTTIASRQQYAMHVKTEKTLSDKDRCVLHFSINTTDPTRLNVDEVINIQSVNYELMKNGFFNNENRKIELKTSESFDCKGLNITGHIYNLTVELPSLAEDMIELIDAFISEDGTVKIKNKLIKRKAYIPEMVTKILQVNSLQLSQSYDAERLLNKLGLVPGDYLVISFIAHEGKNPLLPAEVCTDEFKYYLNLAIK